MLAEEDGLSLNTEGSRIKLTLRGDDGVSASILVAGERLSAFAGAILKAATLAHQETGRPLRSATNSELTVITIVPTTLALGPSHVADHSAIVLRFGEAALGVSIPNEMLSALSQALAAAAASGRPH